MVTRYRLMLLLPMVAVVLLIFPADSMAQRPDAPPYAMRGPYAVGTQELQLDDSERPLTMTVWYPTSGTEAAHTYQYLVLELEGQALLDGPILLGDTPYPLIVFSHGSGGYRLQSLYLTEHLASYGFVVVAADHPRNTILETGDEEGFLANFALRPLDVLRKIEFMTANNNDRFGGMIDTNNIAVVGHSFGGYTAFATGGAQLNSDSLANALQEDDIDAGGTLTQLATYRGLDEVPATLWPATTSPNVRAVVGLAPAFSFTFSSDGIAGVDVPSLILVGSQDSLTPPETEANVYFENVSSPEKYLGIFDYADHYIFANDCTPIVIQLDLFEACSDPVWDMQRAHDITNHFTTAFLLAYLQNDADALAVLNEPVVDLRAFQFQVVTTEE